ncbi:group 1 glycosyl transferase [Mycolicibacterium flavescens]|uniref:glycosyltransferase n=1 Tax=Mycobacterium neumannii TaxID=2048551 RepID=UPI000F6DDFF7|nr:glycosyltransferase [Mycobacterium neumannii]VEG46073.1 group 1 glycosyl transferase [Mycolicibacterium flavescens]
MRPDRADTAITVAHVIHSLGAGGAEAVLVELARVAPAAGMRMVVIGLSDVHTSVGVDNRVVPPLRAQGVAVFELHSPRYDAFAALRVARILRAERVDIVHTHLKHADVVGGLAARLAGVPAVSTLHVIDKATSRRQRLRVRAALSARRRLARTVIALSQAQRRWYTEIAGEHVPITVLPNGVNEPDTTRDRASVREELGVTPDGLLAVCVSLLRPEKGHSDLLEAMRTVPDEPPLTVALAGDGPLLEQITATVDSDPSLRERVRILGFRSDIGDLIGACDFVVHPSREDALPTALISALAAARPIVATRAGGITDIVAPDCGVLVEPGAPAALGAAITDMARIIEEGGPRLQRIENAARQRYQTIFSATTWASRLQDLYGQVIAGGDDTALRRRIALVQFAPSGGLFHFALQLGEGLASAGEDVDVITGPTPEFASRVPGCRVRSILPTWHPNAGENAPEWWRRARRGVRAGQHATAWVVLLGYLLVKRPDVVVWSIWQFPLDGLGVQVVRRLLPHAVLALISHEPRPLVRRRELEGMYHTASVTRSALSRAYVDLDVAVVLGETARRALKETWPVRAPIHVIPHGDEGLFATPVPPADATEQVALAFGTITRYKGTDTLCDAWPLVLKAVPGAELVIAGAADTDIDKHELRMRVSRLERIRLDLGYVPTPHVASYFAGARCVVLPYKRSSQSGVAHLAHTFARPVVASRVGDIPTAVDDGVSGLLVPPEDPEALADALIRLLSDPAEARRMGDAAAQALSTRASWDEVAARFLQALPDRRR